MAEINELPLFTSPEPRLWKVTFSYHRYLRYRGVIITQQVRDEKTFPATCETGARQACRDWLGSQFMAEYDAIGRDISNIVGDITLTKATSLSITSAVPG